MNKEDGRNKTKEIQYDQTSTRPLLLDKFGNFEDESCP